jgi:hypothetical protein
VVASQEQMRRSKVAVASDQIAVALVCSNFKTILSADFRHDLLGIAQSIMSVNVDDHGIEKYEVTCESYKREGVIVKFKSRGPSQSRHQVCLPEAAMLALADEKEERKPYHDARGRPHFDQ